MPDPQRQSERSGRLSRQWPAWLASLALHAALVAVMAAVTWVIVRPAAPEPILAIGQAGQSGSGGGQEGRAGQDPANAISAAAAPAAAVPMDSPLLAPNALMDLSSLPAPQATGGMGASPGTAALDHLSGLGETGSGGGKGTGLGAGIGQGLAGRLPVALDVVFVLDATDSMSPYIEQVKHRLLQVLQVVQRLVPDSRFGVVAYKDYTDEYLPNAVRMMKLTEDHQAVVEFLSGINAGGGGDPPEPIHEALAVATDARTMGWATGRRTRVILLVGDSPVHSLGRAAAFTLAEQFHTRQRGTINVIDVGGATGAEHAAAVQADLAEIARRGGGQAFLLRQQEAFWRHLIVSVFDPAIQQDVEAILDELIQE